MCRSYRFLAIKAMFAEQHFGKARLFFSHAGSTSGTSDRDLGKLGITTDGAQKASSCSSLTQAHVLTGWQSQLPPSPGKLACLSRSGRKLMPIAIDGGKVDSREACFWGLACAHTVVAGKNWACIS